MSQKADITPIFPTHTALQLEMEAIAFATENLFH